MANKVLGLLTPKDRRFRKQKYLNVEGKRKKCLIEYKAVNAYTYEVSSRRDQRKTGTRSDK